jgi:hypothetical protein
LSASDTTLINDSRIPRNPAEQPGMRLGDCLLDKTGVLILRSIFDKYCDGYIAPAFNTAYQPPEEFINAECVLFDPVSVLGRKKQSLSISKITHMADILQTDKLLQLFPMGCGLDEVPVYFGGGDGVPSFDEDMNIDNETVTQSIFNKYQKDPNSGIELSDPDELRLLEKNARLFAQVLMDCTVPRMYTPRSKAYDTRIQTSEIFDDDESDADEDKKNTYNGGNKPISSTTSVALVCSTIAVSLMGSIY